MNFGWFQVITIKIWTEVASKQLRPSDLLLGLFLYNPTKHAEWFTKEAAWSIYVHDTSCCDFRIFPIHAFETQPSENMHVSGCGLFYGTHLLSDLNRKHVEMFPVLIRKGQAHIYIKFNTSPTRKRDHRGL